MGACNLILCIHVWLIVSYQNSVSADQYRLIISRAQALTHRVRFFFWRYPLTSCYFSDDRPCPCNNLEEICCVLSGTRLWAPVAGSSSIFLKRIWNKSCSWAALLKCWFRTDLGRENSTVFYIYMQGRQFLTVTRWSRSTSNLYALIGQNLTGEFMRKIYAASGNLLTDSWSWQSFVSPCDVLNCLFLHGVPKIKYSCYQDCSVIHGWFVYCAFCWQMHRLSKSLEIRFRMASFSKTSLLTCLCLRHKRVEKSQAILEHLMTFRSSISTGKPEQLLSLMCFFRFLEVKCMVYAA